MKLLIILLITGLSTAHAGVTCHTNAWGNYVCSGTGKDYGYQSTRKQDAWGNDTYQDNRGNDFTCSTNSWGEYVCN